MKRGRGWRKRLVRTVDVYDATLHVQFGGGRDEAMVWSAKLDGVNPDERLFQERAAAAATITQEGGYAILMWFADRKPHVCVLAHEAIHAACLILDSRGVKTFDGWSRNDEALALLADCIIGMMLKGM